MNARIYSKMLRTAFKTLLYRLPNSTKMSGPLLAAGVTFAAWTFKKELAQCEMKKAAKDLKRLLPVGLINEQNLSAFKKYANDGYMSKESFYIAMNELGVFNENVIHSFFKCFDKAGDGFVSFQEFVSGIAAIGMSGDPIDRMKFVFQSCDLNGNGYIEKEELRRMIHALLVTRENLNYYSEAIVGPRNWTERKLRYEKQLQNHKRKAYPSTGFVDYRESEQLSIFDEWNRAVLIRKEEESDDYNPDANANSKITAASSTNTPITKAQGERLHQLYREFPELKGQSLNHCLATLSETFSNQIFKHADSNNDSVITYREFQSWAEKGSKDANFLFSLYSDFHLVDGNTGSDTIVNDEEIYDMNQEFGLL
mmetsp:Transcript_6971/g.11479  ORF Transcript_6971/g.11479 Transcript_6971/m.11479 type:complete len:368 (-) Transcript_6971:274-1377(-)